jgi:hypothetical protein
MSQENGESVSVISGSSSTGKDMQSEALVNDNSEPSFQQVILLFRIFFTGSGTGYGFKIIHLFIDFVKILNYKIE